MKQRLKEGDPFGTPGKVGTPGGEIKAPDISGVIEEADALDIEAPKRWRCKGFASLCGKTSDHKDSLCNPVENV